MFKACLCNSNGLIFFWNTQWICPWCVVESIWFMQTAAQPRVAEAAAAQPWATERKRVLWKKVSWSHSLSTKKTSPLELTVQINLGVIFEQSHFFPAVPLHRILGFPHLPNPTLIPALREILGASATKCSHYVHQSVLLLLFAIWCWSR